MFQICALITKLNAMFYELCSDVFLGVSQGMPCLYKEQHVVAALAAPRTQSNLVMSGWHGAKLMIGKIFISFGQVLPTEIHCFWKYS